jgi:hypothetical protein
MLPYHWLPWLGDGRDGVPCHELRIGRDVDGGLHPDDGGVATAAHRLKTTRAVVSGLDVRSTIDGAQRSSAWTTTVLSMGHNVLDTGAGRPVHVSCRSGHGGRRLNDGLHRSRGGGHVENDVQHRSRTWTPGSKRRATSFARWRASMRRSCVASAGRLGALAVAALGAAPVVLGVSHGDGSRRGCASARRWRNPRANQRARARTVARLGRGLQFAGTWCGGFLRAGS